MAELLKYIYNQRFLDQYSDTLSKVLENFNSNIFLEKFTTKEWESLELKQRMSFLADVTDQYLPASFEKKVIIIQQLIDDLAKKGVKGQNLEYIFLADIITRHGLENLPVSFKAIEIITSFTSFEFAGRPFFIKYPKEMMAQMEKWAEHPNPYVRRYASEGCRPRLPWGMKLNIFVDDPSPIIPVLEKLKNDPSEYVLKSVANNLNDISKDHPKLVLNILAKWLEEVPGKQKMWKQAARTMLKKGCPKALSLFGNHSHYEYSLDTVITDKNELILGECLSFRSQVVNTGPTQGSYRLEYNIWFVKSNGQHSKKIFKINDKSLEPGQTFVIQKTHRFTDLTTRKHYPGEHKISLVVNGKEGEPSSFLLHKTSH